MAEDLRRHVNEINRCNQRGGRMLSIVDLVEAGTFTPDLAAYSLAAIGSGASFLVGADPGGAGKTTVMGALLNFVPPGVVLAPADSIVSMRRAARADGRRCYICHEIGAGPYYAYLWGEALGAFFGLPEMGHMMATNLHADMYHEVRNQVCERNGVSEERLAGMNLMFFLHVNRDEFGTSRRIVEVWESDGEVAHERVYSAEGGSAPRKSRLVDGKTFSKARKTIDRLLARKDCRNIEQVREFLVERMAKW